MWGRINFCYFSTTQTRYFNYSYYYYYYRMSVKCCPDLDMIRLAVVLSQKHTSNLLHNIYRGCVRKTQECLIWTGLESQSSLVKHEFTFLVQIVKLWANSPVLKRSDILQIFGSEASFSCLLPFLHLPLSRTPFPHEWKRTSVISPLRACCVVSKPLLLGNGAQSDHTWSYDAIRTCHGVRLAVNP